MERKKQNRLKKIAVAALLPILALALLAGALVLRSSLGALNAKADILADSEGADPWQNKMPERADWTQIVRDSRFALGEPQWERYEFATWPSQALHLPDAAFPVIGGSTVLAPMMAEFARQHLGMSADQAAKFFRFSSTSQAYGHLCRYERVNYYFADYFSGADYVIWDPQRPVELVLGPAPGEEELFIASEWGVELTQKPICRDAFVFITGEGNPVESVSIEQLRGVFSGEITNWSALGGPNKEIKAYQREPGSSNQAGMERLVMGGAPMAGARTVKADALSEAVAEYGNSDTSIGYGYRYCVDNLYGAASIKLLKIDGVAPTPENIASGAYPLSVYHYGTIRQSEAAGPGGLFLDWILSEEGQACVRQAGYIPLGPGIE